MYKVGIVGAAGYTGGELIRLLLNHPQVELEFVHSKSQTGKPIQSVHRDLVGERELKFISGELPPVDVVFLCLGHGKSQEFLKQHSLDSTKIIDLSQDFRLNDVPGFTYGLPELQKLKITKSSRVANPGCFATAIQLALLPLAQANLLKNSVHVHAITGSTGAGMSPLPTTHFSWRENNLSVYKAFSHQHLAEIKESLSQLSNDTIGDINFIPMRGNFTKGIFCTAYTDVDLPIDDLIALYQDYYQQHPFTWVSTNTISLKEVVNTNKCFIHLQKENGKVLISSIIDNLIKGASGQAVQNMNLMLALPETEGLQLKAIGF